MQDPKAIQVYKILCRLMQCHKKYLQKRDINNTKKKEKTKIQLLKSLFK